MYIGSFKDNLMHGQGQMVMPDNSSVYAINCGMKKLPCRSFSAILKEATEHSKVLAMPGVYSGKEVLLMKLCTAHLSQDCLCERIFPAGMS